MSSFAAASLVIGLLALIGVPALWLIFRSGPDTAANREASRAFAHKLRNPELAALEAEIGAPLSAAVARLYRDHALLLGDGWFIAIANAGQHSDECHIAYFQPAAPDSLRDLGEGGACWLAFANDGSGDEYLVDLREADPAVLYLQHETGRTFELAATLAQFLELPRRSIASQ